MRAGIILLLLVLWILSGDDAPQTAYLQKALSDLQEEASFCANRTFGTNLTYPVSEVVTAELTKLFYPENRDPRAHYYSNVTGSFRGDWTFDEEIAEMINKEQPLLPAPKNETLTDGSKDDNSTDKIENPDDKDKPANGTTLLMSGKEGGINSTIGELWQEKEEEKAVDTIEDKRPKYQEDVDTFRGPFQFNESGTFVFNVKETKATEYVNFVKGSWRLKHDDNEDYGISLTVQGIHFVHNGSFYMWGIPEDRMPLWHILDLMPDNASFAMAAAALKERYQKRIKTIQDIMDGKERLEYPETALSEPSSCHYQMYMQLGAISPSVRPNALKDLEREWAAPQGISVIKAPHLNSTLFMYSPNCRLTIGVKKSEGMKREKFYTKAVYYAGMAGTVAFIQVFLLVRQMEYTPTPSSVSKVSYWTIAIQVFIDSYLCMLHLTTGILVERRGRRNRAAAQAAAAQAAQAQATSTNATTTDGAGSATTAARPTDTMPGGLPLPVTAPRPTPPPEDDSPRSDMQALYGRFYWMLIISLVILYKIAISSTKVQNLMISVCAVALFSFWIPQIIRNVIRGSKKGLSLWFILGMSATRLTIPVYFYGCPDNLMGHEPTPWIWGLVAWVALQVGVLLLQDWLGPRFFVPKKSLELDARLREATSTDPSRIALSVCSLSILLQELRDYPVSLAVLVD
ncbi:hypothetical protein KI688_000414 [Linnemannia hyalina]|uniref:RING-type E3 ubiquitin transferase n=1 Tax=Linnemannia hyalina TaxID=64524 RepID=A0A9P7Y663_9FUNG|nr:hypothetical protein KI688_000414 [Linnemannia hyalina]